MNPVVVIGLGNPFVSDEGIGVRVLAEILESDRLPAGVDFLDLGTGGFLVVHELPGREKAVFIDCAQMGEAPGTIRRFTPDQVVTRKVQPRLSLHEGDLMQTLELAKRVGEVPGEIVIFGIEPESVEMGEHLSPALSSRLAEYVDWVLRELK